MGIIVGAQHAVQPGLRPVDAVPDDRRLRRRVRHVPRPRRQSGAPRARSATVGVGGDRRRRGGRRDVRCIGAVRRTGPRARGSDSPASAASACSSPSPSTTADQPGLDWAKLLVCTAIGAAIGARPGAAAAPDAPAGARSARRSSAARIGWLIGAWGGADLGGGTLGEALIATVVPLAAIGARIGMSRTSDDDAPGGRSRSGRGRGSSSPRRCCSSPPACSSRSCGRSSCRSRTATARRTSVGQLRRRHLLATTGGHRRVLRRRRTGSTGSSEADCGGSASPSSVSASSSASSAGELRRQAFAAEPGTVVPMLVGFFLAACAVLRAPFAGR